MKIKKSPKKFELLLSTPTIYGGIGEIQKSVKNLS